MSTTTPASTPLSRSASAVREVVDARELIVNLVRRDLKARYRGTVLGLVWSLATPLLMVALYTFIFNVIFRLTPTPDTDYPFALYFFGGLVLWNFFSQSLVNASNSVVGSAYLLRKLYFPRSILPLTSVLSGAVTFGFEATVLLAVAWALGVWPTAWIVLAPAIIAVAAVMAYGLGLLLSALTVFFRDISHFMGILLQLWFWGTPIIYSLALVADRPRLHMALVANPMTGVVIGFRAVVLDGTAPDFAALGYSTGMAVLFLGIGTIVFQRSQRMFAELV